MLGLQKSKSELVLRIQKVFLQFSKRCSLKFRRLNSEVVGDYNLLGRVKSAESGPEKESIELVGGHSADACVINARLRCH